MALIVSPKIRAKLADKHSVSIDEVKQCFANRCGNYLEDEREDHKSDPPTLWFVAETDFGKKLKVCFICESGNIYLRTAFPADPESISIFERHGK